VFVGDEAFPLKEYLMKPYNQRDLNTDRRIYNYRLSRARRVVENASRFRILLTDIHYILRLCLPMKERDILK
jgi:hypothetical protein